MTSRGRKGSPADAFLRVLVVSTGPMRASMRDQLSENGFLIQQADASSNVLAMLGSWRPQLLLIDEGLPSGSARSVVANIRAQAEATGVSVVVVASDAGIANVFGWLQAGATDVWRAPFAKNVAERARKLIDECRASALHLGALHTRFSAWASRAHFTGTVCAHAGTPFEGRAVFVGGQLETVHFASWAGAEALERLLDLDGALTFDEAPPLRTPAASQAYRPRVLLVDDDPALRLLATKQLESARYVVEAAGDGQSGLQLAALKPWDIVIADLNLPKFDGWGLLRSLQADVALRETPVLVLSAQEGEVETLKASRAGARAYLKKSGRMKELLDAIELLVSPRARVWNHLAQRQDTPVELRALGPMWFLRALAELDCSGALNIEDEEGRYELVVAEGQLVQVASGSKTRRHDGWAALEAMVLHHGVGRFTFREVKPQADSRWMYDVVDELCDELRRADEERLHDAAAKPGRLFINEELATLFSSVASAAELKVLEGFKSAPDDLQALVVATGLPRTEVEPALNELLRRGVLSTSA